MNYVEIKFKLSSKFSEQLADIFLDKGALSVSIEDANSQLESKKILYDESNQFLLWDNTYIIAIFYDNVNIENIINESLEQLNLDLKQGYEINTFPDEDWIKKTQLQFESVKISNNLWIIPSWAEIKDFNAVNIRIDPGLAFGTGTHPTTNLCLQMLEKNIKGGERVLYYGCGSGILSIASKKLGANLVVGVDIDKLAIKTSIDNAINNGEKINFYLPDDKNIDCNYDIVIANILTNPLKLLVNLFVKYTNKKGYIILSGILESQEKEIKEIYSKWFEFQESIYKEGWVCILGKKF